MNQNLCGKACVYLGCPVLVCWMPWANAAKTRKVYMDVNCDGLRNGSESGLPGITVTFFSTNGTVVTTGQTDKSGNYLLDPSDSEPYRVEFIPPPGSSLVESRIDANNGGSVQFTPENNGIVMPGGMIDAIPEPSLDTAAEFAPAISGPSATPTLLSYIADETAADRISATALGTCTLISRNRFTEMNSWSMNMLRIPAPLELKTLEAAVGWGVKALSAGKTLAFRAPLWLSAIFQPVSGGTPVVGIPCFVNGSLPSATDAFVTVS